MPAIDGLASGLNTTSLIQQLMQIERQPQTRLRVARQSNDQAIEALKGLNTKFLALGTASAALTTATGWQPMKATSTDETVAVATASAGAKASSLSFTVKQLAAAGSAVSSGSVAATTDVVATGATIDLTKGTDTRTINVGDGTLGAVVDAINAEKMGVTAMAVQVSPGSFKLQLSSTTTGADTSVSVAAGSFTAGTLGDTVELTRASDAVISVDGTNPYTVTRSSNTIGDLLDDVTITLRDKGLTSVKVEPETAALIALVRKMVDAANAALTDIGSKSAYDTENKKASVLTGDGMLRGLQSRLLGAFSTNTTVDGATHGSGQFGITVERDGTIAFDEAAFTAAHAEDPGLTQAVLGGDGLAGALEALAKVATAPAKSLTDVGLITGAIDARKRESTQIDAGIKNWDRRLELREQALVRQFTQLETALSRTQSQGDWLAGQLAALRANG